MGKGITDLLLPAAAIGAVALTGGAAAPALAGAAGAGGAGAAAGGLGLAGNALAAQGAAGLLGGAGATAAGYGASTGLGALASQAASALPEGMAAFGPNGEYMGATIGSDGFTANSFTGGFDDLNFLERGMQRLGGMDFNGKGLQAAQKGLGMMQGGGQQQPQQQAAPVGAIQPRQQQLMGSFLDSANMSPFEIDEMIKRRNLMAFQGR